MRSMSWRAGWSVEAKKSGSARASRSTGICSRANHTRSAAGMRSSARMAWNMSATISMIAFSLGLSVLAFSSVARRRSCSAATLRLTGADTAPVAAARPPSGRASNWVGGYAATGDCMSELINAGEMEAAEPEGS